MKPGTLRRLCLPSLALPALALTGPTILAAGEGEPVMPPLHEGDGPNLRYRQQLQDRIESLKPEDKEAFFKALRAQERQLRYHREAAERSLKRARSLAKELETEKAPTVVKARSVAASEEARLRAYKDMAEAIQEVRHLADPQRMDAEELKVDIYGGFQFSSLYRDPGQNASFFSKSRPFVSLDIRQAFRRPGKTSWFEGFSTLSFQSASFEQSDAASVITSSGQFKGEAGIWWMKSFTENVSWGVIGSVGAQGYRELTVAQDPNSPTQDQFRSRWRLGFTLRQETGALKGSFAEWSYVRDPLFQKQDRLLVRGRVVLTQFGSEGASGDFYMEGFVNKGGQGQDEAVLLVGIRLSTIAFLRSLGAGGD